MASVNKVILVGNLGRDPETRYTTGGEAVTNVSIATTDSWKDKAGEKQERTEWHRVAFFGKLAEIAGEYLKKGSQVYVEGRLQTRKWQDKEGQEKYTTEIIADRMQMLGSRAGGGGGGGEPPERERSAGGGKPAGSAPAKKNVDDLDDDIPFYRPGRPTRGNPGCPGAQRKPAISAATVRYPLSQPARVLIPDGPLGPPGREPAHTPVAARARLAAW